jgi:hypothetical protein
MTLGVGAIFWFISHTMPCQPKEMGLHIYSWSRQPSICRDASLRCCPSNDHTKDHKDQQYKTYSIKDKFLITMVEELLDELRGTSFFTKLDLRSCYHQVLMHLDDVEKTTFHKDQGLFEFLVKPFDLTNAPATFQALMNEVLQSFQRQFVLIFFNDIFIYNSAWSEHLRHVQLVFEKLQQRQPSLYSTTCVQSTPPIQPW